MLNKKITDFNNLLCDKLSAKIFVRSGYNPYFCGAARKSNAKHHLVSPL